MTITTKFDVKERVKFYYRNMKDEPLYGEIYDIEIDVDPAGHPEVTYTIWADKIIKSSHKHYHHESEIEKL